MMKGVEVWSEEEDRFIFTDKRRFHDDYFSLFGQLEAGVNNTRWADMFLSELHIINLTKISKPVRCRIKFTERLQEILILLIYQQDMQKLGFGIDKIKSFPHMGS